MNEHTTDTEYHERRLRELAFDFLATCPVDEVIDAAADGVIDLNDIARQVLDMRHVVLRDDGHDSFGQWQGERS